MVYLFIRHRVRDYGAWNAVFDGLIETRRAGGEKSWQIWHPDNDTNNLILLFEWDSLDNAKAFVANPELKTAMEDAGLVEAPEVYFLEEYDRGMV